MILVKRKMRRQALLSAQQEEGVFAEPHCVFHGMPIADST
jgi:hypothetical protein